MLVLQETFIYLLYNNRSFLLDNRVSRKAYMYQEKSNIPQTIITKRVKIRKQVS